MTFLGLKQAILAFGVSQGRGYPPPPDPCGGKYSKSGVWYFQFDKNQAYMPKISFLGRPRGSTYVWPSLCIHCAFVSVSRGASQIRTVARGWAVWAMVHQVFLCFIGKICKILQSRHFLCCLAHLVSICYLQLCKWIFVSKCLLCFWKMGKVNDP